MLSADADDAILMAAVRSRDETALRTLYERYGSLVFAVAFRVTNESGLAQEVAQDAFVRCWDRATAFDPSRGSLRAWLIGITRNRALDALRSRKARGQDREEELPPFDLVNGAHALRDDVGDGVVLKISVRDALQRLPAVQREAIELAAFGGLTQNEIAGALNVPLGTIKTRIRDGMARMRAELAPWREEDVRRA